MQVAGHFALTRPERGRYSKVHKDNINLILYIISTHNLPEEQARRFRPCCHRGPIYPSRSFGARVSVAESHLL